MISSTDKAEPTKSEVVKDEFSQADRSEESQASDDNTHNTNSIENEALPEPSDGKDDGAELEPEEEELRNQLLRVMADNENLRKCTEREVVAAKK